MGFATLARVSSAFEHTALLYDDREAVVTELVTTIERDVGCNGAVLVCVGEKLGALLRDGVVGARDRVHVLTQDRRYSRPIGALDALWRFNTTSVKAGCSFVHSIGEIGFSGGPTDADWHWYEAAVNDVFAGTNLRATCLFDTVRLPDEVIEHARTTHRHIRERGATTRSKHFHGGRVPARTPLRVPDRTADMMLPLVSSSRDARAALRAGADGLDSDVVDRAAIVISELVTNAALHGGGHAAVDLWFAPPAITIRVRDDGPGIRDPFASLRPPELPSRGAGLWICHQESSRFVVDPGDTRGTTVIAVID